MGSATAGIPVDGDASRPVFILAAHESFPQRKSATDANQPPNDPTAPEEITMPSFLKTLFGGPTAIRATARRRDRTRLIIESLERRSLMAVTATWVNGSTWAVQTDNAATTVTVGQSGSNLTLTEGGSGRTWYRAAGLVGSVQFHGGAGSDRFINNVSYLPVTGFGYGGNDYLEGYNGADQFLGGEGADTLVGYGGNDSLWGGAADDLINGMGGDDYLDGEDGFDTIYGGDG